jgi:RNA polymerase sigma factor (sigma-70 family)
VLLNEEQRELVKANMGLVGAVIKKEVKNVNNLGIFTYEDIFQIGCEGLSKAAFRYVPGRDKFSTCAYIYIRNEIFNALDYATVRRRNEEITDLDIFPGSVSECDEFEDASSDLDRLLDAARARATGVTAKGIDAIRLMAQGYKCREIGEMMGGVSSSHVTAWISKARAFLRNDPAITAVRDAI